MKELQNKARQSLKGETHNLYRTKLQFTSRYIEHGIVSETKNC